MRYRQTARGEHVLDMLIKTFPTHKICSYENLGRIMGESKITNEPRFWNERCEEVLSTINDINVTFHRYPEKYKMKMIVSPQFESLFTSQIFLFLRDKIKHTKNSQPEDTVMMIKLCGIFLKIGLGAMKNVMPSEFLDIFQKKFDDMMLLMYSINQYTKRIDPKHTKSTEFNFDFFNAMKKTKKKTKKTTVK